jgi:hypothetical protein
MLNAPSNPHQEVWETNVLVCCSNHPNVLINNYCIQVYIAAKALIDTINSYTKEDGSEENPRPVWLLIYIDESHEMTTSAQTIKGDRRNVYEVLCSCLTNSLNWISSSFFYIDQLQVVGLFTFQ